MMIEQDDSGWNRILSVSQLNEQIRDLLAERYPYVKLRGEISKLSAPSSGHLYFSLIDEFSTIRAVVWRSTKARMTFQPRQGDAVVATGRIDAYPPRGEYQFIVEAIQPEGAGGERERLLALHAKLEAEGLFDESRKQPLPYLPETIGVVTSQSGAAIHDIIQVLETRFAGFHLILAPALVQGVGAPESIAAALTRLDASGLCDVIICGRGGGSAEDLACFNSERVVRAIAACRTPIVSAVGHEVDVTLADMAADLRAATPSAAAERVMPEKRELRARIDGLLALLQKAASDRIRRQRQLTAALAQRLQHPKRRIDLARMRADEMNERLADAFNRLRAQRQTRVEQSVKRLNAWAGGPTLARASRQLNQSQRQLGQAVVRDLQNKRAKLAALEARLHALSPLAVLERGYAIARNAQGEILRSTEHLNRDETIAVTLAQGSVEATVTRIKRK
ncbi:exodeoxyribonuclease VII large subunit [Magnetofaba australis]|nr:exodeoxyribonuclease VII large subunit [Magnetofaba australis]